jgi:hypothetical protein
MQFATKIQRKIYFAKRKASMFFISALACVGSIVPAAASEPALLSTDGDVETIKAVCRLWAKWGLLFLAVVAFFYFKTKGNERANGIYKGALTGTLVTWILALNDGAILFMIFDFFKYLAGLIGG